MLDTDQGVASERFIITNARAKAEFLKSYFHESPLQERNQGTILRGITVQYCFVSVISKAVGLKLYFNKVYVNWSKVNNLASCFEAEFRCEFFPLREWLLLKNQ